MSVEMDWMWEWRHGAGCLLNNPIGPLIRWSVRIRCCLIRCTYDTLCGQLNQIVYFRIICIAGGNITQCWFFPVDIYRSQVDAPYYEVLVVGSSPWQLNIHCQSGSLRIEL